VLKEYGYGLPITGVNMNKGNGIFYFSEDVQARFQNQY
jgi:hypothetical protein